MNSQISPTPDLGPGAISMITRIVRSERPVVFLMGSALSLRSSDAEAGVASVREIVATIRERVPLGCSPDFDKAYVAASKHEAYGDAYRLGFEAVFGSVGGQDAADAIIRDAVLRAHRPLPADEQGLVSKGVAAACDRILHDDHSGWLPLRSSVAALGQLLVSDRKRFPHILTTNFDPLIEVAIYRAGGLPRATVLSRLGGSTENNRGAGPHVIYLHGYWYGHDTLHTKRQLTQERPQLKSCLERLMTNSLLVVLGYGGWADIVMNTLVDVANDSGAKPDVLWGFYGKKDADIELKLAPAGERVQFYESINLHELLPHLQVEHAKYGGSGGRSSGSIPAPIRQSDPSQVVQDPDAEGHGTYRMSGGRCCLGALSWGRTQIAQPNASRHLKDFHFLLNRGQRASRNCATFAGTAALAAVMAALSTVGFEFNGVERLIPVLVTGAFLLGALASWVFSSNACAALRTFVAYNPGSITGLDVDRLGLALGIRPQVMKGLGRE